MCKKEVRTEKRWLEDAEGTYARNAGEILGIHKSVMMMMMMMMTVMMMMMMMMMMILSVNVVVVERFPI